MWRWVATTACRELPLSRLAASHGRKKPQRAPSTTARCCSFRQISSFIHQRAALVGCSALLRSRQPPPTTTTASAGGPSALSFLPQSAQARLLSASAHQSQQQQGKKPLSIFFGSQTGTAQGFAFEFAMEAEDRGFEHDVVDLAHFTPDMLDPTRTAVFLLACYGKGEPTDNAKEFYSWVMQGADRAAVDGVDFAVFGLGNQQTHAENFCVIGRRVDRKLAELGARRLYPRVDGDDSDCIETQFDEWQAGLLDKLEEERQDRGGQSTAGTENETTLTTQHQGKQESLQGNDRNNADNDDDTGALLAKFAGWSKAFRFVPPAQRAGGTLLSQRNVFDMLSTGFYNPATRLCPVLANHELTPRSSRSTAEMHIDVGTLVRGVDGQCIDTNTTATNAAALYTTGDHAVAYPSNTSDVVDAYLDLVGSGPGVAGTLPQGWYDQEYDPTVAHGSRLPMALWPLAPRLTFRQVLTHCVELMKAPSPGTIRQLRNVAVAAANYNSTSDKDAERLAFYADHANYNQAVVAPFRTVLDLLVECASLRNIHPKQFLDLMPRLQPRFYSISSSSQLSPGVVHLTYRVVQMASQSVCGAVRLGVCSHFLRELKPNIDSVPLYLWESSFRLPEALLAAQTQKQPASPQSADSAAQTCSYPDPRSPPVIMIAGGTGIAPFKAFLEERMAVTAGSPSSPTLSLSSSSSAEFPPMELYYGVRDETELVYADLIASATKHGCLTRVAVGFDHAAQGDPRAPPVRVDVLLLNNAANIWRHVQNNAHIYVCGGAHGFGPCVVDALCTIFQTHGNMDRTAATDLLSTLMASSRYMEDLSD